MYKILTFSTSRDEWTEEFVRVHAAGKESAEYSSFLEGVLKKGKGGIMPAVCYMA